MTPLGLLRAGAPALVAALVMAMPLGGLAQGGPNAPSIVPCEGPDMPAACPPPPSPDAGGSTQAARDVFAARQASQLQQQQQFLAQHQGLAGRMYQARRDSLSRQPRSQTDPLLTPPNLRAAAQAISGIVKSVGGPP